MAGFLVRKWLNRPFFNQNITKKLIKTKQIRAIFLLVILAQIAIPFTASASIFDWISNFGAKEGDSGSSNQALNSPALFLSADMQSPEIDAQEVVNVPFVIQGNFLVAYNSPKKTNTSADYQKLDIRQELIVPITAYSSTTDQTDNTPFTTARGTYVRDGIVAANFLPFGTKIKIPDLFGDKVFVVEDRMNRKHSYKIDVWFPDRQSALEFGIKTAKIQIIGS